MRTKLACIALFAMFSCNVYAETLPTYAELLKQNADLKAKLELRQEPPLDEEFYALVTNKKSYESYVGAGYSGAYVGHWFSENISGELGFSKGQSNTAQVEPVLNSGCLTSGACWELVGRNNVKGFHHVEPAEGDFRFNNIGPYISAMKIYNIHNFFGNGPEWANYHNGNPIEPQIYNDKGELTTDFQMYNDDDELHPDFDPTGYNADSLVNFDSAKKDHKKWNDGKLGTPSIVSRNNGINLAAVYHFAPKSRFSPFIKLGWHVWTVNSKRSIRYKFKRADDSIDSDFFTSTNTTTKIVNKFAANVGVDTKLSDNTSLRVMYGHTPRGMELEKVVNVSLIWKFDSPMGSK